MKKIFSLVLALVMALSLTTVAWGAEKLVSNAAELISTIATVQDGDVIKLTGNVTFNTTDRSFNSGSYYDGVLYTGGASFTIDLGGYTITSDAGALNDYLLNIANKTTATANTITIKNGTLTAVSGVYSALCVGSSTATAPTTVNTENLTINGVHPEGAVVKIRGGATWNANAGTVVNSNGAYTALECSAATANINAGAKLNQTNSSADPSVGSAIGVSGGGVVNVNGAEIGSDRYGAFVYPTGGTLNVISGTVTAPTALYCDEYTAGYYIADSVINVSGGTITGDVGFRGIDGGDPAISISGGTVDGDILANTGDDLTVSGGTFTDDVSDYVADGSSAVLSGGKLVVSVGNTGNTNSYDASDVTIVAKDGSKVTIATDAKVVMTQESKKTVNGKFASVIPAHFTYNGVKYVVCHEMSATHLVTVKGVQYYTCAFNGFVPTVEKDGGALYTAPKKATCGKVGANEDKYVVIDNIYYLVSNLGTRYVLVNDKMVVYSTTTATAEVHVYDAVKSELKYNSDRTVANFKCAVCNNAIPVVAKKPAFATNYTAITLGVEGTYYYVTNTAGISAGSSTPSTDKTVTSAETFDAGIAMYVGMSVMAAAGSAVVIGKKKD